MNFSDETLVDNDNFDDDDAYNYDLIVNDAKSTAYHEAAHLVIATLRGHRVRHLFIDIPKDDSNCDGILGQVMKRVVCGSLYYFDTPSRWEITTHAIGELAGMVAESLRCNDAVDMAEEFVNIDHLDRYSSDWKDAVFTLQQEYNREHHQKYDEPVDDGIIEAELLKVSNQTLHILKAHWDAVTAVAEFVFGKWSRSHKGYVRFTEKALCDLLRPFMVVAK